MKKNKLRIGIFTHNYPTTSKERKDAGIFIYDFANELSKHANVFVFCPDFGGKKEIYKKVPVTWFKWDNKNEKFGNWQLFNPVYVYKFFKLIYIGQKEAIKFVEKNKIDYVLSCWAIPSSMFAWRVNLVLKKPYASWSLGSDVNKYTKIPILSQFISLSLSSADKLFANSYALIEKVEKMSNQETLFLPAITNFNIKIKKTKNIDKKFHFLFVGRLEAVKGPDLLIYAIEILSKKYKNFVVDILGDGSMSKELRLKSKNISNFIKFYGWADEMKVAGFMAKSNALVIPSRNESLPLVIIEAAKEFLPVVATKVGDCERVIKKYNIGYSVVSNDASKFADGMYKIIKKNKFPKKGFLKLTDDFSQERTVKFFLKNINAN